MRDYTNITTAIWRDPVFRSLHASQQRTYMMVITQDDISGAGTLALTVRRWAKNAADTTAEGIEADLAALESNEFVYVDDDTEEVLIRTFVKHDRGFTNPKRKPVILAAAKAIRSEKLRRILWAELGKLGLADSLPPLADTSTDSLSGSQSTYDRVVVTVVTTDTSTLNPQTVPPSAGDASLPPRAELALVADLGPEPRSAQEIVAWYIDHCDQRPPNRVIGPLAKTIKELLDEGIEPVHIRRGINEWAVKEQHHSTLPGFVNAVMNRRAPIRAAPPQQARTDVVLDHNQQVAAQIRALEGRGS